MDGATDMLESAAAGRLAVPVRRGFGLVSLTARHALACCPGKRQVRPKPIHNGNARTPESSCTASRMIVTTTNPPKPVAILSLNTSAPCFLALSE